MVPGDIVTGRFKILRGAGSGGMGVVYQARDLETGGNVALKLLIAGEEGLAARFAQEVELLSALEHPHIIGYISHGGSTDGASYLVMPWLEGQDLQERLRARPLSVEETLTVARCVADALAYLHRRGLVHRDLKPSNLFLPDGNLESVKVIDLGIARGTVPSRPLTLSGVLMGTPGFIAPEQAYGAHGIAPTVDIFALGCVLFECLTGKRLFSGPHVMAVLAKILLEEAPRVRELRPDVPEGLDWLIDRMVAKEPELRPQDGAELQEWLLDLERGSLSPRHPVSVALTATEQRMVSVLVVILSPMRPSVTPMTEVTRAEVNPLQTHSVRFGVEIHALAEGVAIALAPEELSAADGAAVLARFGAFVAGAYPGAHISLATGSAVTGARARLPVGDAIDRGVMMVRAESVDARGSGMQVDEISAALLTSRFDVLREDGMLYLQGERLSLDPTRPLLGRPTSCVGRERELTILDATFTECLEGAGPNVVLVTAPSGAGKSRLRHEFVRRLGISSSAEVVVLNCQGDPLHLTTPYAQVAQAVRQMAELHDREDTRELRERLRQHVTSVLPEADAVRVTDFLGELMGAAFDDEEHLALKAARHNETAMANQIRMAFEDIVRAWCKKHPVVLVMEDLHWSDAMSVKLLDGALRKLAGVPLLVLALARPEVHERFPLLWGNRHVTEIRLPPLSAQASSKLVHEVIGDDASDEDIGRIVDRSEGNAFYLEELIRAAVERARRRSSLPPPMQREGLPETIIAVAQARLERLEPDVRKVLRAASIFGESFWLEGVCALVAEGPQSVVPILDVLVDHEAVVSSLRSRLAGARELTFRHALLRGAAYATLTEEDRKLGHRLAAQWLEGADEDREVVALHWLEGGDRARAARAFADAGETRLSRAQADAAARCAVRSLLVMDAGADVDEEGALATLRVLAEGLENARHIDPREVMAGLERHVQLPDDARGSHPSRSLLRVAVDRALEVVRSSGGPVIATAFSRAACALGALSDFAAAKSLLARASAMVAEHEASARTLRYAEAKVASWEGEFGAVAEILSSTLLPANARERVAMLLLLAIAVVSVDGREALPRGLEYVTRAEALSNASKDDPVALVNCSKARLLCFFFAGEHQRAAEASEEAVELARRASLRYEEGTHLHNVGESWVRVGHVERGRAALIASNVIADDLGTELIRYHNDLLLAYLDSDAVRLEKFADMGRVANNPWREVHARYWLARLLSLRSGPSARREFGRALALARELKVHVLADECALAMAALPPDRQSQFPKQ
jgi:hypothetical protein